MANKLGQQKDIEKAVRSKGFSLTFKEEAFPQVLNFRFEIQDELTEDKMYF
jgi:hypothetical protein